MKKKNTTVFPTRRSAKTPVWRAGGSARPPPDPGSEHVHIWVGDTVGDTDLPAYQQGLKVFFSLRSSGFHSEQTSKKKKETSSSLRTFTPAHHALFSSCSPPPCAGCCCTGQALVHNTSPPTPGPRGRRGAAHGWRSSLGTDTDEVSEQLVCTGIPPAQNRSRSHAACKLSRAGMRCNRRSFELSWRATKASCPRGCPPLARWGEGPVA